MPKVRDWREELEIDPEDQDLLDHVMYPNGRPVQGLHADPVGYSDDFFDEDDEFWDHFWREYEEDEEIDDFVDED